MLSLVTFQANYCLFFLTFSPPAHPLSSTDVKLRSNPGTFIPVFVDNKDYLMTFLEKMTEVSQVPAGCGQCH